MSKEKVVTYLVMVQRENNRNSWKTYCECETLDLAKLVAYGLTDVPCHIARKTVETTYDLIAEKGL